MVEEEIQSMLGKGAIKKVPSQKGEFLSSIFLVPKKDGGNRPVINLKNLNSFIPYQHFKMEGLHVLRDLIQEGDFMCKIDLKDAYFVVPIAPESKKFLRFLWGQSLFEFQCLCFGLGPAPLVFTKLMKVPVGLLRRLNIRLIIFLDDILIIGTTQKEVLQHKETVVYLLQSLGFVINTRKSVVVPTQQIEFLGMMINSKEMTVSLPQGKVEKIIPENSQLSDKLLSFKVTALMA